MKNWPTKKLGEVADCTDGDWILSKDLQTGKEVRLIQLGDIGEGVFLDKTDKWISKKRCKELKCTILKQGDILLARLGDPLGKACIFPGFSYPCITAVDVTIIRAKSQLDPNFLLACLNSQFFRNQIYEVASGATRKRISRRNLEHLQISLPPLSEQKRIVKKIEKLFGKIDEVEKLRKEAIEDTENLLKSAMREVFERGKKEDWPTKKLGEILNLLESGSRPKGGVRHIKSGIPSIGAEHLDENGRFNFKKLKFIPFEFFKNLKRGIIKKNDILIIKDGATTGKTSFVGGNFPFEKAAVNEHVFILRVDKKIVLPRFLFLFLFSERGQTQILKTFHGAAQGGINSKFIDYVKIPLPPLSKQKQIVAYLDSLSKKIRQLKELQNQTARELSLLRQSILDKAFKGRL